MKSAIHAAAALLVTTMFSGCGGVQEGFATRHQIIEAAARCGVPNLKPTKAGINWAAYVEGEDPDHGPNGNCIYADLKRQGLRATR